MDNPTGSREGVGLRKGTEIMTDYPVTKNLHTEFGPRETQGLNVWITNELERLTSTVFVKVELYWFSFNKKRRGFG